MDPKLAQSAGQSKSGSPTPDEPPQDLGGPSAGAGKPAGTGAGGIGSGDAARTGAGGTAQKPPPAAPGKPQERLAVEQKPKRVRRTKAQIEADRQAEEETKASGGRQTKAEINAETVNGLLDAFDVFAGMLVGEALAPEERALIQPSLERVTGRMSSKASKRLQTWVDPLCILGGFGLFTVRVLSSQAVTRPHPTMPVEKREGVDDKPMPGESPRPAYSPPAQIADLLKGDD